MLNEVRPNALNQAEISYQSHDNLNRETDKLAWNIVDAVSSCKEVKTLTDKSSTEVAKAVTWIYECEPPIWVNLMQVVPGCKFMGTFTKLLIKRNAIIHRARVVTRRGQGMVERLLFFIKKLISRKY